MSGGHVICYGKCMCAAFRLLKVTEEQSKECKYPVSGFVLY